MVDNTTVVIRTADERTAKICELLIVPQIPKHNLFVIKEKPFSKAVQRMYEIGIDQNNKWMLAVDGDVLVKQGGIAELIQTVESLNKNILKNLFVYQGKIICKMFGQPRQAGFHLYQTKFLKEAYQFCNQNSAAIKPESFIYEKMIKRGKYHFIGTKIYALHAYEQYYRDMYRNGYFRAKKHYRFADYFMKYWAQGVKNDLDFKALFYGWTFGLMDNSTVVVGVDFFNNIVEKEFPKIGLVEKEEINIKDIKSIAEKVDKEIKKFEHLVLKRSIRPSIYPLVNLIDLKRVGKGVGRRLIKLGQVISDSV